MSECTVVISIVLSALATNKARWRRVELLKRVYIGKNKAKHLFSKVKCISVIRNNEWLLFGTHVKAQSIVCPLKYDYFKKGHLQFFFGISPYKILLSTALIPLVNSCILTLLVSDYTCELAWPIKATKWTTALFIVTRCRLILPYPTPLSLLNLYLIITYTVYKQLQQPILYNYKS